MAIIFLIDERDLLPASNQSGADFNVYPQYSRIKDRVAWLKDDLKQQRNQVCACLETMKTN